MNQLNCIHVTLQLHRDDVLFSTDSRSVFQAFQTLIRTSTCLQVTPLTAVQQRKRKTDADSEELNAHERQCSLLVRYANALEARRTVHLARVIRSAMQQILPLTFTLQNVNTEEEEDISRDDHGPYHTQVMRLVYEHREPLDSNMMIDVSASSTSVHKLVDEEVSLVPLVKRMCVR